jgi:hypothetical protein
MINTFVRLYIGFKDEVSSPVPITFLSLSVELLDDYLRLILHDLKIG